MGNNNIKTSYSYDYSNRLTSLRNQTTNGNTISEYTSEYLDNGQKSKEISVVLDKDGKKRTNEKEFVYDLLGRITKETSTGKKDIIYTYDNHNNRKEMIIGDKVVSYKYNLNDELIRTDTLNKNTEEDSVVLYKYDKNGNELGKINRNPLSEENRDKVYFDIDVTLGSNRLNENVVNYYDVENHLTNTFTENYKLSYEYDEDGLRISKTVNGEKTVFVWDNDEIVMELSGDGKVKKRYIRGNDLVYSDCGEGTDKQFYIKNPHGDVVQLLDDDGNVIKDYEYDAFGNEGDPELKDDNPFRYCGEYYDKETDSIYLRARYYQPVLGRFLTRDSYAGEDDDPLSLHLYTYCGNDGVNRIDPSGNVWETILDIAFLSYDIYSMVTHPSWENAAFIAWDVAATALPLVPGSYVAKVGKGATKIASKSKAIQKGTKYAKIAGSKISKGKALGKNLIKKATTALTKRVDLGGRKLLPRTRKALEKAAVHAGKSKYKSFTKGFTEWLNRGKKDYVVYFGMEGTKSKYVGITKQKISKRLYQHRRKGKNFSRLEIKYSNLTLNQAKSIEQYYIKMKNGPNQLNKINSISPTGKYKNYYQDALDWAKSYINANK